MFIKSRKPRKSPSNQRIRDGDRNFGFWDIEKIDNCAFMVREENSMFRDSQSGFGIEI